MGTIYGLINRTRQESIRLHCKYLESLNYSDFIVWLSFEWNKEEWHWVHDNNGFRFPQEYYDYPDRFKDYQETFKEDFQR